MERELAGYDMDGPLALRLTRPTAPAVNAPRTLRAPLPDTKPTHG
ncbi:hypothetical protein thalar_00283 [Litoreibacter arenae DSM 19593]|uniref:Uncharacterized protein n=1 Tax=Litoreibacter arenae DSM 19593 TaxID=1123360 RepID=S9QJU9_9RHOB|nr:hypothetical protein thalar_00283 [Litoreibacter arenae DSM 19593]